ncbi:MAG TPA: hypothetical protein VGP57_23585 [Actinoplanes sp.]|jgi:hypothetical protein|nr:hypothetical protein [Actinoplanes sp.]
MSDATPDSTDHTPAEPAAAATGPAEAPAAVRPAPVGARWWNRRLPLVLTAAALVVGCFLGACVIGVGAIVIGYGDRGDDRGYSNRDGNGGGRNRQDAGPDEQNGPGRGRRPDQTAPSATATTPGASIPPSPAAS